MINFKRAAGTGLSALFLAIGLTAVSGVGPAAADGWNHHIGLRSNTVQGENARIELTYDLYRFTYGPAGCVPPDAGCTWGPYGWKFVQDRKWNPPGGASTVAFAVKTFSGASLPWATMSDGATHCWFPNPITYVDFGPHGCQPNTGTTTAWNTGASPYTTTYKATVSANGGASVSCYVINVGGGKTVVPGYC